MRKTHSRRIDLKGSEQPYYRHASPSVTPPPNWHLQATMPTLQSEGESVIDLELAQAIEPWVCTRVVDLQDKANPDKGAKVWQTHQGSTLEMDALFYTSRGRCTCTRRRFQKSWAFPRATFLQCFGIRTTAGGRRKYMVEGGK
ncbi:hypothetical protein Cob_v013245 [Colletotrichum orbiculare MAFF 240422]|uniref:Uncharacterized protein n=1 Tax=Colletotrichum orbiculare (strain 104-T / ATCC 96160 / CBS 514.97 / LARS 414 / MAFF 240422) TaxID=1213857 RepID=A0A484F8X0_COLOR|nr:hypothetical protein Cob_v013245 [Colletotrichum orbiculare MAFF 240422]